MKKNIAMRVAAILFILTMISTCAFSTTFAKYVTTDEATDSARVAKWGVTVTANLEDLFEKGYKTDNTATTEKASATVLASADYQMLAPGTKHSQDNALVITGTPEVAVKIDYVCDVTLTGWSYDDDKNNSTPEVEYCPLVIKVTVDGVVTEFKIDATNDTVLKLEQAIENHITALSKVKVYPNEDLTKNISLSWSWEYQVGSNADEIKENDAKDTALGDKAVAGDIVFGFKIGATVTQVD